MQKTVGMLIHLSINTQPEISSPVNILSRYANSPTEAHWNIEKNLLKYLKGTPSLQLLFKQSDGSESSGLRGWADAD